MKYYVYILTNYQRTVLYIGFTGNLIERMEQHKSGKIRGFAQKYKANILIYYEEFSDVNEARAREFAMKKWKRAWKEELINKSNSDWQEVVIL